MADKKRPQSTSATSIRGKGRARMRDAARNVSPAAGKDAAAQSDNPEAERAADRGPVLLRLLHLWRSLRMALIVFMAANFVLAASDIGVLALVNLPASDAILLAAGDVRLFVSAVYIFCFATAAVLFARLTHRISSNLWAVGAPFLRYSPVAAFAWNFVPLVGLWLPFDAMRRLWRASMDPDHASVAAHGTLNWWWFFWCLAHVLIWTSIALAVSAGGMAGVLAHAGSARNYDLSLLAGAAAELSAAASAACAMEFFPRIQKAHDAVAMLARLRPRPAD